MSFAEKVKLVRTELKLSQEDLARELGVSFATINRWENGSYNPSRLAKKAFEEFCINKNLKFEVHAWTQLLNGPAENLEK